jgi:hypothetical protein
MGQERSDGGASFWVSFRAHTTRPSLQPEAKNPPSSARELELGWPTVGWYVSLTKRSRRVKSGEPGRRPQPTGGHEIDLVAMANRWLGSLQAVPVTLFVTTAWKDRGRPGQAMTEQPEPTQTLREIQARLQHPSVPRAG